MKAIRIALANVFILVCCRRCLLYYLWHHSIQTISYLNRNIYTSYYSIDFNDGNKRVVKFSSFQVPFIKMVCLGFRSIYLLTYWANLNTFSNRQNFCWTCRYLFALAGLWLLLFFRTFETKRTKDLILCVILNNWILGDSRSASK